MIITDEHTQRAVARLSANPDFVTFMRWLKDEELQVNAELRCSTATAIVHQLQGSARLLWDIEQAVTQAPFQVAGNPRRHNS